MGFRILNHLTRDLSSVKHKAKRIQPKSDEELPEEKRGLHPKGEISGQPPVVAYTRGQELFRRRKVGLAFYARVGCSSRLDWIIPNFGRAFSSSPNCTRLHRTAGQDKARLMMHWTGNGENSRVEGHLLRAQSADDRHPVEQGNQRKGNKRGKEGDGEVEVVEEARHVRPSHGDAG